MNQYGEACAHHSSSEEEIFLTQDKLGYFICSSVSVDGKRDSGGCDLSCTFLKTFCKMF